MTGKELLKTIRRERLKLEKLKKERQEEKKYFQVLRAVSYEGVSVSGGHVSTLDDALERQEAERVLYIRRFDFIYSSYCDHLVQVWQLVNDEIERDWEAEPGLVYMLEYYSHGLTYKQLAPKTPVKEGYLRMLIQKAVKQFEEMYQARDPPPGSCTRKESGK